MDELRVVFRTASEIEARVVRGLLETHGIASLVSSDLSRSVFPLAVEGLGDIKISVHAEAADEEAVGGVLCHEYHGSGPVYGRD